MAFIVAKVKPEGKAKVKTESKIKPYTNMVDEALSVSVPGVYVEDLIRRLDELDKRKALIAKIKKEAKGKNLVDEEINAMLNAKAEAKLKAREEAKAKAKTEREARAEAKKKAKAEAEIKVI
jgi:hypothetical protein